MHHAGKVLIYVGVNQNIKILHGPRCETESTKNRRRGLSLRDGREGRLMLTREEKIKNKQNHFFAAFEDGIFQRFAALIIDKAWCYTFNKDYRNATKLL